LKGDLEASREAVRGDITRGSLESTAADMLQSLLEQDVLPTVNHEYIQSIGLVQRLDAIEESMWQVAREGSPPKLAKQQDKNLFTQLPLWCGWLYEFALTHTLRVPTLHVSISFFHSHLRVAMV
jgi:hypothetical protein